MPLRTVFAGVASKKVFPSGFRTDYASLLGTGHKVPGGWAGKIHFYEG